MMPRAHKPLSYAVTRAVQTTSANQFGPSVFHSGRTQATSLLCHTQPPHHDQHIHAVHMETVLITRSYKDITLSWD